MSYCRWTSQCDLYCYKHVDGTWTTHVDDKTFKDFSLADFKARLLSLREEGYRFPDYALERIDDEMKGDLPNV